MQSILTLALVGLTGGVPAQTAKQIIDKSLEHSYLGQDGSRARVKMTLTSARGTQRVRELRVWSHKKGKRVRSLVRITAPPDVAGTSFLLKERAGGGDDMWLYIPSLKRTRRIIGRARQGRFLGSDFNYSDMEARELKDANYKRLADGKIGRYPCFVIQATPKASAGSMYSKVVAWIRKDNYIAIRLKMYDKRGRLLKKMFVRRLGRRNGKPIIKETRMVNVQSRTSTLLRLISTRSLRGRTSGLFTVRNLARGL